MILEKIKNCKNLAGIIRLLKNSILLNEVYIETSFLDDDVSIYERLFNIKNNLKCVSILSYLSRK